MIEREEKIELLKNYFSQKQDISMAFIFGSQSKVNIQKNATALSDWDIAAYFKPFSHVIEWENNRNYPEEDKICGDLIEILQTDNVDFIVLNRAPSNICASAIKGFPLIIKDRKIYLEFMLIVTREAEDFRQTTREYADVYWRSFSLSDEDRDILNKRLIFLDSELRDADKFYDLTQLEYERDSMKRRQTERWIENLVNAAIDISKTILASEKRPVPSTYREILRSIGNLPNFTENLGEQLANWTELRNILAHEYLDIRWKRISDFIKKSEPYFKNFIQIVKDNFLQK